MGIRLNDDVCTGWHVKYEGLAGSGGTGRCRLESGVRKQGSGCDVGCSLSRMTCGVQVAP